MKIVVISDTHQMHKDLEIPDGDVLLCCGDFTAVGSEKHVRKFNKWMGTLPHEHKLVISGNHDWFFQRYPRRRIDRVSIESICTEFTYVQDETITIDGINFYGAPWTPEYGNWAFTYPRDSERHSGVWDQIPLDTDVLFTHGPPYGILDKCPESQGCKMLLKAVENVKPKFHFFGHIHEGYGRYNNGHTEFVNAAIMDEDYNPVNKPMVVEITK